MTEKKAKKKKRKKNRQRWIIPIYLVILALLIAAVYVYPSVTGAMKKTMTIQYGSLENSHDVTCYFVKNEIVYFSDYDGSVGYHFTEGTGVRAGTEIVTKDPSGEAAGESFFTEYNRRAGSVEDMGVVLSEHDRMDAVEAELREQYSNTDSQEIRDRLNLYIRALEDYSGGTPDTGGLFSDNAGDKAPDHTFGVTGQNIAQTSGILSYEMDGYEAVFNPYTMSLLDRTKLESLSIDTLNVGKGKTRTGEPLFKIVDNHKWYAVTWIEPELLGSFSEGREIVLQLPKGNVKGTVAQLYDDEDGIMLIAEFDCYYEDLGSIRRIETKIMTSDSNGLMVDNSFIVSQDGVPGVYVRDVTGDITFTPVKILDSDGVNSLVASGYFYRQDENGESKRVETVNVYDEIEKVDQSSISDKEENDPEDSGTDGKDSSGEDKKS